MKRVFAFALLTICSPLFAQQSNQGELTSAQVAAAERQQVAVDVARQTAVEISTRDFAGLSFGVGISATFDTGSTDRINSATIVDGIVRVEDEQNRVARIMLESHYFFLPDSNLLNFSSVPPGSWGWGPFVALQPGTDEIIEAIGLGLMLGFRREASSPQSWNIGLGYVVDPNVKVLGDGFRANREPPGNETIVRFQEKSQQGVVLLFSFSF